MTCHSQLLVNGELFLCDQRRGHHGPHHGATYTWQHVDPSQRSDCSEMDLSDDEALAVLRRMIGKSGASNRDVVDAMYARDGRAVEAAELRKQVANLTIALVRDEGTR